MSKIRKLFQCEGVRVPLGCLGALVSGYLLSVGTVCGVSSPLAAALAGICHPLYAFAILLGSLLAYAVQGAPEGMHFLLTALVGIFCIRILFHESQKPHILAVMTAAAGVLAAVVSEYVFRSIGGRMPLYILEALLTGVAAYFLSDALHTLRQNRKIILNTGKSFTFAMCYLLVVTAFCGMDFTFCNVGRMMGIAVSLLAARHFRQTGGTLCGALTACGVVLCSVQLGVPLLFLPVTAMLAGFISKLPNALYIPVFFFMQMLSSAVFDSSAGLAKVILELMLSCLIYALCSHVDLQQMISQPQQQELSGYNSLVQHEQFLGETLRALREETAAVMRHLKLNPPVDAIRMICDSLCMDCKNYEYCWQQRMEQTEKALQQLLHHPYANPGPAALDGCIRHSKLLEAAVQTGHRAALVQIQRVQMSQNRAITLEYLRLIERMTADTARRRSLQVCSAETQALRMILRRCGCEYTACIVHRLRSGRYAAEVYTKSDEIPLAAVQELLGRHLGVSLRSTPLQKNTSGSRFCVYETPPYYLEYAIKSVNAPDYERCGDHADAFTDAVGNQYLVLSDGMGSGSSASLASKITVRTFCSLVSCDMPEETAIQLINSMLLTETNTENFATLDVLKLCADSGELVLYKSGAAPTLFRHMGCVRCISDQSFPVGIVPRTEPSRRKMTAYAYDQIVMLSDGVCEEQYPLIKELLAQELTPEAAAESLCAKAASSQNTVCRDDMTVIIAKICTKDEKTVSKMQKAPSATAVTV